MDKRKCENCWYWEKFNGVCCCAGSDEVADFTDREFVCKFHKFNGENEPQEGLFGEE